LTDFDDLYVRWRLFAQGRAVWGCHDIDPHLAVKSPKTPKMGLNTHFQAKPTNK